MARDLNTEFTGPIDQTYVSVAKVEGNWVTGRVSDFTFQAKVFADPSEFGINDGRISKLWIVDFQGKTVVSYDRGRDIQPKTNQACEAMEYVLGAFA